MQSEYNSGGSITYSISQSFYDTYLISLTVPYCRNYLIISGSDMIELQHYGIWLFDGEFPEQPKMYDVKLYATITASGFAKAYIDSWPGMEKEFA